MHLEPHLVSTVIGAFLLGFPALFSIVNPIGSSLIFYNLTSGRSHAERAALARSVAINAALVLAGSLWLGAYVLNIFGVSLSALRIGGGLVVAATAWRLLMQQAAGPDPGMGAGASSWGAMAFFPLTIPVTTGPGSIAVAIALASERPLAGAGTFFFFLGLTLAACANAALVLLCNLSADRVLLRLGDAGSRVVTRLSAFLLLCIGVQIMSTGVEGFWGAWPEQPGHVQAGPFRAGVPVARAQAR